MMFLSQCHDHLHDVVPHKAYYAISFRDIPADWELGGKCLLCRHVGAFGMSRDTLERLCHGGRGELLRTVKWKLRCTACGNNVSNQFAVVGRIRRWRVLPSGRPLPGVFPLDLRPPAARAQRLSYNGISLIAGGYGFLSGSGGTLPPSTIPARSIAVNTASTSSR